MRFRFTMFMLCHPSSIEYSCENYSVLVFYLKCILSKLEITLWKCLFYVYYFPFLLIFIRPLILRINSVNSWHQCGHIKPAPIIRRENSYNNNRYIHYLKNKKINSLCINHILIRVVCRSLTT